MPSQTISDLERGRIDNPSLNTLKRIAEDLDIGIDELIGHGVSRDREEFPEGLRHLLDDPQWADEITDEWVETLLRIDFQGRTLQTKREFLLAYLMLEQLLDE